jgi:stearoyl-CoA desaturase (delta-9 desaturase)
MASNANVGVFERVGATEASEPYGAAERRIAVAIVVTPFIGFLAAIFLFWERGIGPIDLWLLFVMYLISGLGIGVGYHRLCAHRSFETKPRIRALVAIWGSLAAEGPVLFWAAIHRRHHKFSDTEDDPHSPHFHGPGIKGMLLGLWHAHVGWLFVHEVTDWHRYIPDLLRDRRLFQVNRLYFVWLLAGVVVPGVVGGLLAQSWHGALSGLLWGGLVRVFFVHHVTWSVNSICHYYGTQPFESRDEARNNPWLSLLSLGESWHNNHHAFPSSAINQLRWWQVDVCGGFIRALESLGLAWNVKVATERMQAEKRARA